MTTPATTRETTRAAGTTATEHARLERYNRTTRWYHAGVYLLTFGLLATGWWLLAGKEGRPSVLARATGVSDVVLHKDLGWALAGLGAAGVIVGAGATITFVRDSFSIAAGDGRWLLRWPAAAFTGRFGRHDGHFDPGQRIANVLLAGGLLALVGSGVGLVLVHGGSAFVWLARVHRYTTYVVTVVVAGHVLIASGALPGYRGVGRSMHLGGRLREDVARRLWPGWTERALKEPAAKTPSRRTD